MKIFVRFKLEHDRQYLSGYVSCQLNDQQPLLLKSSKLCADVCVQSKNVDLCKPEFTGANVTLT